MLALCSWWAFPVVSPLLGPVGSHDQGCSVVCTVLSPLRVSNVQEANTFSCVFIVAAVQLTVILHSRFLLFECYDCSIHVCQMCMFLRFFCRLLVSNASNVRYPRFFSLAFSFQCSNITGPRPAVTAGLRGPFSVSSSSSSSSFLCFFFC